MKSKATTVAAYLDSLPTDRREAIQTVRRVILENLDRKGPDGKSWYDECMQYGAIGYCVPHSVWPPGHHVHPETPLMYMGLSSQKNDMVVYMMCLYQNAPMREWFDKAWKATGKKLNISGVGGCCLRFRKVDDLSLDLIAEVMRRIPVKKYLEHQTARLAQMGKSSDGKPLQKSGSREKPKVAKAKSAPPKKKTAKKKTAPKRG
jgi:hypothetical protein